MNAITDFEPQMTRRTQSSKPQNSVSLYYSDSVSSVLSVVQIMIHEMLGGSR